MTDPLNALAPVVALIGFLGKVSFAIAFLLFARALFQCFRR